MLVYFKAFLLSDSAGIKENFEKTLSGVIPERFLSLLNFISDPTVRTDFLTQILSLKAVDDMKREPDTFCKQIEFGKDTYVLGVLFETRLFDNQISVPS